MNTTRQKLPYTNVYVDTSLHAVHIECEGFVPSDIFRQTLLGVVALIKDRKLTSCIYDLRQLKKLPPLDQDWFLDEVLPLLLESTLRNVAVLESATSSSLLDLSQLVYTKPYSVPFELQYFEDVAPALEWISNTLSARNRSAASVRQNNTSLA